MPEQIHEMASVSMLRYLPSYQVGNRLRKRYREWQEEILEDFRFKVETARNFPWIVRIRESINVIFFLIGPFMAIFALAFKAELVNANLNKLFNTNNKSFGKMMADIILYIGFVNQIASIRKVRLIEMHIIQHFVFSGNNIKLSRHEKQMMNIWWN